MIVPGNGEGGTGNVSFPDARVASSLSLVFAGRSMRLHVPRFPFPVPVLGHQA